MDISGTTENINGMKGAVNDLVQLRIYQSDAQTLVEALEELKRITAILSRAHAALFRDSKSHSDRPTTARCTHTGL